MIFIMIAAFAMIVMELATTWNLGTKLFLCAWIAVIIPIILYFVKKPATPATRPAAPADADDDAPKQKTLGDYISQGIAGIVLVLMVLAFAGGCVWTVLWVGEGIWDFVTTGSKHTVAAIQSTYDETSVPSPLPTGHSNVDIDDGSFSEVIRDKKVRQAFYLQQGQRWGWYFAEEICYRIRKENEEVAFTCLDPHEYGGNGKKWAANYAGVLEVKTDAKDLHVQVTRFN